MIKIALIENAKKIQLNFIWFFKIFLQNFTSKFLSFSIFPTISIITFNLRSLQRIHRAVQMRTMMVTMLTIWTRNCRKLLKKQSRSTLMKRLSKVWMPSNAFGTISKSCHNRTLVDRMLSAYAACA